MGEIASYINVQAQFHVSRLLKLKSFRADIQQQFLILEALNEQITQLMQEAATEASIAAGAKNPILTAKSLFRETLPLPRCKEG